jgi:hypothetical protein
MMLRTSIIESKGIIKFLEHVLHVFDLDISSRLFITQRDWSVSQVKNKYSHFGQPSIYGANIVTV